jgi:hypothetical protein
VAETIIEVADPYAVVDKKAGAVYRWKANDLKAIGGSGGEAGTGRNSAGAMGLEWISGEVAHKLDQWKQDMDLDPLLKLPFLLLVQLAVQLALEQAI